MKKNTSITLFGILILLVLGGATSALGGYYSIGVGNGGTAKKKNFSLEAGSSSFKNKSLLIAVALTIIDHGDDNIPPETFPNACPNDDHTYVGKIWEGIEGGFVLKAGKRWNGSNTYFSLLGGVTQVNEIRLTQSNTTEKYYTQSSEKKLKGLGGISVGYFPEILDWKLKLTIQIDYDNRRGITGAIGWCW